MALIDILTNSAALLYTNPMYASLRSCFPLCPTHRLTRSSSGTLGLKPSRLRLKWRGGSLEGRILFVCRVCHFLRHNFLLLYCAFLNILPLGSKMSGGWVHSRYNLIELMLTLLFIPVGAYHGRTFGAMAVTKSKTVYSGGTHPLMVRSKYLF